MNVRRSRRCGSMRRICPTNRSLRLIIAEIMLKSGWVAVSLKSFPVMVDRHRLLKPLIDFRMLSVRLHASQPWVKAEHTPAMYSLIFKLAERRWSDHMCDRLLNVVWAMAIL